MESDAVWVVILLFNLQVMSNSFVTPWTVALQAPLSVKFPRQEYWNGLPFPSSGDLPNIGIKPASPALQADSFTVCHQRNLCLGRECHSRMEL